MPYSRLGLKEAAAYLHMDVQAIQELVKNREVPFTIVGRQTIFYKNELNQWISQRLLKMKQEHLDKFHHRATELRPVVDHHQVFLSALVTEECIQPELHAKTLASVLKELAALAMRTGLVSDEKQLYELLREREAQGPTALEKGIALPHPAVHPQYLFLDSFIIIARLPSGIHIGALDHKETDLFFMPCAHDDRQHVYMLARLALMLNDTTLADELRQAADAAEMLEHFRRHEQELVARMAQVYRRTGR